MKLHLENVTGIIQCEFDILLDVQPVFYTRYNQLNSFTRMLHNLTLMCRKKLDDGITGLELLAILTEMKLADINNIRPYIRDGIMPIKSSEVLVRNDGSGLYRVVISERESGYGGRSGMRN